MRSNRAAALTRMFPASPAVKEQAKDERRRLTRAENGVWALLGGRPLDGLKFRRKHPLGQFVIDFYSPSCLLAIEVIEGDIRQQTDLDRAKFAWLTAHGVDVLQLSDTEIEDDLFAVKAQIEEACSRSGMWWYESELGEAVSEEKIEVEVEVLLSIPGIFQHGVAFPLRPLAGMEGRQVIITFLNAE
jgi:very-short-patch-repair endonuclease